LNAKTPSWTSSPNKSKSSCWELLPWLSGKEDFGGKALKVLAEEKVRGAISHVVQASRANSRSNPIKDVDQELSILLSRQFRAFRNEDPKQVRQKALPFAILDELAKK
jgi:hypothetical protein